MFFVPYEKCFHTRAFISVSALIVFTYFFNFISKTVDKFFGENDLCKFGMMYFVGACFVQLYIIAPHKKNEFKLNRVLISTIHASLAIFAYMSGVSPGVIKYISVAYYLSDLMVMLTFEKSTNEKVFGLDGQTIGLALHHIVCVIVFIAFMDKSKIRPDANYLYRALFFSEVSNLPMYAYQIVNIINKIYETNKINKIVGGDIALLVITICEFIMFFVMRIIGGGYILYKAFMDPKSHCIVWLSGVFIMGVSIFWTNTLWNKIVREYIRIGFRMKKIDYITVLSSLVLSIVAIVCL